MKYLNWLFRSISQRSDPGSKSTFIHPTLEEMQKSEVERREKDNVDELIAKNGFYNCCHGRYGYIYYVEDGHLCEIYYEPSDGLPFNIALSSLDLRKWARPEGKTIPRDKQLEILHKLRSWLREQKLRTGIDQPTTLQVDRRCAWRECTERRIKGSAYCPHHYDLNLLRE